MTTPFIIPTSQTTSTLILPTPKITAIPSPLVAVEPDAPQNCIALKPVNLGLTSISGFFVVEGSDYVKHLLNPKANQFLDIDKNGSQMFHPDILSPNKKYMLAYDERFNYLIRTTDKTINTSSPDPKKWIRPRWLDNERITFLGTKEPNQDVLIWNPITDDKQIVHLNLPNPMTEPLGNISTVIPTYIYPTLRQALYTDQNGRLILEDIETQKEMASLSSPTEGPWFLSSAWSPDGAKFVTSWPEGSREKPLANELYVFDINGNLQQLTKLSQEYAFANVESPVWSPDGRHIGFWLRIGESGLNAGALRQWLAVLDTDTLETTIYCLADKPQPWESYPVVWSPDGQQLIVNFGSQLDNNLKPILVDLTYQTQSVIDTQNMLVDDWMAP